jgi:hypothetical protein
MTASPTSARSILVTALLLALTADLLLRTHPWGLNFAIVALATFAGVFIVGRRMHDPVPADGWPVALMGILLSACLAWRDADELSAFNVVATVLAAGLVSARRHPGKLLRTTFFEHLHLAAVQAAHVITGAGFLLLSDLRSGNVNAEGQQSRWNRAWLGIALALPALLVFGSLLTSADGNFEYLITEVFQIDFWTLVGHTVVITMLGWGIGGWLRGRFLGIEFALPPAVLPNRPSLGMTEVVIVLGSLDLLFGTFVVFQLPHFFGGHDLILGTPVLTYAEYARRGFFELIVVAALTLSLLLAVDWLFRSDRRQEHRIVRALSVVMIALVGVMLASAMHRLVLYMEAYGMTTARVHAAAILLWIALGLVFFCATVLRGKRDRLPYAMIISGFLTLLAVNVLNPDAFVARVNMERLASDGTSDPRYTFNLSADAVPTLLGSIGGLPPEHRSVLADRLVCTYGERSEYDPDIRSWNAARVTAHLLVHEREAELRKYIIPGPIPGTAHQQNELGRP